MVLILKYSCGRLCSTIAMRHLLYNVDLVNFLRSLKIFSLQSRRRPSFESDYWKFLRVPHLPASSVCPRHSPYLPTLLTYFSGRQDGKKHEKDGYQQLWRKIKTPDRPDGGVPFDTEDAMFNPPTPRRMSAYNTHAVQNHVAPLEPLRSPAHAEIAITGQPGAGGGPGQPHQRPPHAHHKQSRNRVIPQDEDIRRLFQECNVGRGNASLLSNSLTYAKPKDLKKDLIQVRFPIEFHPMYISLKTF